MEEHLCQNCGHDIFEDKGNFIICSKCGNTKVYYLYQSDSQRVTEKERKQQINGG